MWTPQQVAVPVLLLIVVVVLLLRGGGSGKKRRAAVHVEGYCRPRENWASANKARQEFMGVWMSTEHVTMGSSQHGDLSSQRAKSQVGAQFQLAPLPLVWQKIRNSSAFAGDRVRFVDVGCGIGNGSATILGLWPKSSVLCIEGSQIVANVARSTLKRSAVGGGTVHVVEAIISDSDNAPTKYFGIDKTKADGASGVALGNGCPGGDWRCPARKLVATSSSMTLDTLLADPKNKAEDFKEIDLMYVDVIGYEGMVFRGAAKTLTARKPKVVVFECSEKWYEETWPPYTLSLANDMFENHGYDVFYIATDHLHMVSGMMYEPEYDGHFLADRRCLAVSADWQGRNSFVDGWDTRKNKQNSYVPYMMTQCGKVSALAY